MSCLPRHCIYRDACIDLVNTSSYCSDLFHNTATKWACCCLLIRHEVIVMHFGRLKRLSKNFVLQKALIRLLEVGGSNGRGGYAAHYVLYTRLCPSKNLRRQSDVLGRGFWIYNLARRRHLHSIIHPMYPTRI